MPAARFFSALPLLTLALVNLLARPMTAAEPADLLITRGYVVDTTQIMTIHTNPPSPGPKHDAGWDAFTKMYAEVSKVTATAAVCLPKPL